jgi:hypothetical protein
VIDVAGRADDDVLHPLMFIVLPDARGEERLPGVL